MVKGLHLGILLSFLEAEQSYLTPAELVVGLGKVVSLLIMDSASRGFTGAAL